jgi:hypothetical protein
MSVTFYQELALYATRERLPPANGIEVFRYYLRTHIYVVATLKPEKTINPVPGAPGLRRKKRCFFNGINVNLTSLKMC